MIVVIDNYDSFTYTLVQYFGVHTGLIKVFKNDEIAVEEIDCLNPDLILLSPGPKSPREAGITEDVIRTYAGKYPIFGVCLGHQAIGDVFGASVQHAPIPIHGKISRISNDGKGVFAGIPSVIEAVRYNSLVVTKDSVPEDQLIITAESEDGLVMGLRHRRWPVECVQFHPESFRTSHGRQIIKNVFDWAVGWKRSNVGKGMVKHPAQHAKPTSNQPEINARPAAEGGQRLPLDGLCSACGLCASICPHIDEHRQKIIVSDSCMRLNGLCTRACPWSKTEGALEQAYMSVGVGEHQAVYVGKAGPVLTVSSHQHGGVVSGLVCYLLTRSQGRDAVVAVTRGKNPFDGEPQLLVTPDDINRSGKTVMTSVPSLTLLPPALQSNKYSNVHVVGRGCQVRAATMFARQGQGGAHGKVGVTIGLFCDGTLDNAKVDRYFGGKGPGEASGRFVREGFLLTDGEGSETVIDYQTLDALKLDACRRCADFTAEGADISVGGAGGDGTMNVIVARTDNGMKLLDGAVTHNYVWIEKPSNEAVERLHRNARQAKERTRGYVNG